MTWVELLDDIERRLANVEQGLGTGAFGVDPFTMPDDLGPLPGRLRDRAVQALRRTAEMEAEVAAVRDRTADALRRGRTAPRATAAYVDTRA